MNRNTVNHILVDNGYLVSQDPCEVIVDFLPHRLVTVEEIAALLPMAVEGEIYSYNYKVCVIVETM